MRLSFGWKTFNILERKQGNVGSDEARRQSYAQRYVEVWRCRGCFCWRNAGICSIKLTGTNYFNVKDFGALGDGSTNDEAAIERAIEAANPDSGSEFDRNQRGGVVYLPAGTYRVGRIRLRRNVTLMGEGPASIIVQADGNNTAVIAPSGEREYPVGISDLRIRGARNPGGDGRSARGILLNTLPEFGGFTVPDGQHIVNRVWIERTHAENIMIAHSCRGTLVADCWLSDSNTAAGLTIDGSGDTLRYRIITWSLDGNGTPSDALERRAITGPTSLTDRLASSKVSCVGQGFSSDRNVRMRAVVLRGDFNGAAPGIYQDTVILMVSPERVHLSSSGLGAPEADR